eukprot:UN26327
METHANYTKESEEYLYKSVAQYVDSAPALDRPDDLESVIEENELPGALDFNQHMRGRFMSIRSKDAPGTGIMEGLLATEEYPFNRNEVAAFTVHYQSVLSNDIQVDYLFPIKTDIESLDLLDKIKDGVLIGKYVNLIQKNTIDFRAMNVPIRWKQLKENKITEDLNICLAAAKTVGIVRKITVNEIMNNPRSENVVEFLWDMIETNIVSDINILHTPILYRLKR